MFSYCVHRLDDTQGTRLVHYVYSVCFDCRKVFGDDQMFVREVQCYGKVKSHIGYGQDVFTESEPRKR